MPLPLTVSCSSKISRLVFTFSVPAHLDCPRQRAVKRVCLHCWCRWQCGGALQKQDTVDTYRRHLERHQFHISQLETIMRLVDNDALPISQVSSLLHGFSSCLLLLFFWPQNSIPREWKNYAMQYKKYKNQAVIITNEYYYSAVESKRFQENLTTEKIKRTTVSRRIRTGVRLSEINRAAEGDVTQWCDIFVPVSSPGFFNNNNKNNK